MYEVYWGRTFSDVQILSTKSVRFRLKKIVKLLNTTRWATGNDIYICIFSFSRYIEEIKYTENYGQLSLITVGMFTRKNEKKNRRTTNSPPNV